MTKNTAPTNQLAVQDTFSVNVQTLILLVAVLCSILAPATAFAGPGANIYACVYLPVAPAKPIQFEFTAGSASDICMHSKGHNAPLTAKKAGITCVSIGYVESDSVCIPSFPKWTLGYSATEGGYSGTAQTKWLTWAFGNNELDLEQQLTGTYVCSQENMCNATKQQWRQGTQGPLYIIFQPGAH